MKNFYFLSLSLFFSLTASAYDPKEGNVTALFGPFVYQTNFQTPAPGSQVKSPVMMGPAIIAGGDINDHGSLEAAMIHLNKIFIREQAGRFIGEQTQVIHINLGYRYWFTPYVSTSLGFFSAYSMGDPKIVYSDFTPGSEPTTSAQDYTEYGFDLSLQVDLWSNPKLAVILDTRYSLSITGKESHERADHYGAIIGVKYLIQSKVKPVENP